MKSIFKLILAVILLIGNIPLQASSSKNDIVLIVTSDGVTKDEAVKNALRSAIEQAYGVFVSANTDILNDELVKDEIATLSSGNIKNYKELAVSKEEGKVTTTLEVIVSKGKLISYAKSKGAEFELNGEAMFADIQLQELYKQNEEKLFENLCNEVEHLLQNGYDYKVDVKRLEKKFIEPIGSGGTLKFYVWSDGSPIKDSRLYKDIHNDNDNDNNVYFECDIFAKLNEQGELAWNKLMETLKEVGQPYNSNKLRIFAASSSFDSPNNSSEFSHIVYIVKPSSLLHDERRSDVFKVRSSKTMNLVNNLMEKIPYIVKNISIKYADNQLDISEDLNYLKENPIDGTQVRLNETRPYSKKKGSNCGEYRYLMCVPKEDLKDLKKISVQANEQLNIDPRIFLK